MFKAIGKNNSPGLKKHSSKNIDTESLLNNFVIMKSDSDDEISPKGL